MSFNLDTPNAVQEAQRSAFKTPDVRAAATAPSPAAIIDKSVFADLLKHGGVYKLTDPDFINSVIGPIAEAHPERFGISPEATVSDIQQKSQFFFYHLVKDRPYKIDSSLISHITSPFNGRTFSQPGVNDANTNVPAFMTFIGQFIDHDLTLNALALFNPTQGNEDTKFDDASPLIDLDSVYNRESMLANGSIDDIFNSDGTFKLRRIDLNAYDLERDNKDIPFIYDRRNDENQLILQIHILLMRVHNKLVSQISSYNSNTLSRDEIIEQVKLEVQRNWQSFILTEYLPTIISSEPLNWVLKQITTEKPKYGDLRHKPFEDGTVRMPHEFAIGFRMGHSMLRDRYHLNPKYSPIFLFDNRSAQPNDLRGNVKLQDDHVIDWDFFSNPLVYSNKIDAKVTDKVFDLPESAIPDEVKKVGNLPQRNLIRSFQVDLAAGEDVAILYGLDKKDLILTPENIEPDPELRKLFQLDDEGRYNDKLFRTPLWYYILKEAEYYTGGQQLGPLGGRIVAEVIAGGIYYLPSSFVNDTGWNSKITNSREVKFKDLVDFVREQTAQQSS